MDWSSIITAVAGALLGGGGTYLFNIKANRKKANAEADITASQEWHNLYDEQHARNAELSAKVDALAKENTDLKLENQQLRQQIQRNTEDIDELRKEVAELTFRIKTGDGSAKQ